MTSRLKTIAAQVKKSPGYAQVLNGSLTFNELLILGYKAQTGCTQFHTFKDWKKRGFNIIKGSKGFPIFSRPINVIKAEQGKESTDNDKFFGTCYLFNESQVKAK